MTVKSQTKLSPSLLQNKHYSGTITTFLYNWPIFCGVLVFGVIALVASSLLYAPWNVALLVSGILALLVVINVLIASFIVYDRGDRHEYDRLMELGKLSTANVVIDITAGKLRGTRGLLSRKKEGHYFVVDIFDPEKMTDQALRRARELEPPLDADRRIYRRTGKPGNLPIPHNWADVVYCSFSLHELQNSGDRDAIFAEFARILKPNGRLLISEHGRDLPNILAFGPGVLSYLSPSTWKKHMQNAGFSIETHERWRGLAHLWVARRKPR